MAQRSSSTLEAESRDFAESARTLITALRVPAHLLLNMDQTAITLDMPENTTWDATGSRTVQVRTTAANNFRVTVALCSAADGTKLKPLIVFKAQPNGRIARSFSASNGYPIDEAVLVCQSKGWMDTSVVIQWIEEVRKNNLVALILIGWFSGAQAISPRFWRFVVISAPSRYVQGSSSGERSSKN